MKKESRERRHHRITKRIFGTEAQPRLVVFRSKKHMCAQLVNDAAHRVIAGTSTRGKEFLAHNKTTGNKEAAKAIGKLIAAKALKLGIKEVSFDRAGDKYHGRGRSL